MKLRNLVAILAALSCICTQQAQADNLLTGGDFEAIGGPSPPWVLQEFVTGSMASIDSAEVLNNSSSAQEGVRQLFIKPFAGGAAPGPNNLTNMIISQTVTGSAGQEYTFSGWSRYEANYAGGVEILSPNSPLGEVASPTTNSFIIEFLNGSNAVIGSPFVLDVTEDRIAQIGFDPEFHFANDNILYQHSLNAIAPTGTTQVRVTANALDMVFNTDPAQSAFYDSFSLKTTSNPATELLQNAGLEDPSPSGLTPWTVTINDPGPIPSTEVIRVASFANHTPGGATGVWFSSFIGEFDTPVDGTFSQTLSAVVGGEYTLSGWSRWEANFSGGQDILSAGTGAGQASPTQVLMEIAFLDSLGEVIGSPTILDVKTDRDLQSPTSNPNDNLWYQHEFSAIAPVGAVDIRVSGMLIDGVGTTGGQSAFFDDFVLELAGASLPGDFDGDGAVTGRDFLAWQRNPSLGSLATWQSAYNGGALAAVGSVPEPTTILSLAVGLVVCGLSRRGRIA